jgi:hypothetical protein
MDYAHVTNGTIDVEPTARPTQWKDADHRYGGLNRADDAFLLALGWYPVTQIDPPFNPATETYADQDVSQMVINFTDITWTRAIRPLTVAELQAIQDELDRIAARKAPPVPSGNSIPALRAEVAALRQVLIDAGILDR